MTLLRTPVLSLLILLGACGGAGPERKTQPLIDAEDMAAIGATAFDQLKAKGQLSADYTAQSRARCIADQLIAELPTELAGERWETRVFEAAGSNAFALPGGKIGVHSGLFEQVESEGQLAAVIAHELGHLIEGHVARRLSDAFAAEAAVAAVQTYRGDQGPQVSRALYALLGLGPQVGMTLPFTAADEAAADGAGLRLLARAGYDPGDAVLLWQNLALQQAKAAVAWLATHPNPERHVHDLRAALPGLGAELQTARDAGKHPHCAS